MLITLLVIDGPDRGRKATLRSGQTARIGRTEWADFSFPGDAQLADIHFSLQCTAGGARVRVAPGVGSLFLNDKSITDAEAAHGDKLRAGQTTFSLTWEDAGLTVGSATIGAAAGAVSIVSRVQTPEVPSAESLVKELDLNDAAKAIAVGKPGNEVYVQALADAKLFMAAVRVQAHILPKRKAVWWGVNCVEDLFAGSLPAEENEAVAAARAWVVEPEEAQRRAAEAAAQNTKLDKAGGWLAMAVFWSGGSLTGPTMDIVPPDARLCGQGLTNALMIAAVCPPANKSPERYGRFLKLAADVAGDKIPLPEKPKQ